MELDEEESKRYMHQYNFPPYSVGRQDHQEDQEEEKLDMEH